MGWGRFRDKVRNRVRKVIPREIRRGGAANLIGGPLAGFVVGSKKLGADKARAKQAEAQAQARAGALGEQRRLEQKSEDLLHKGWKEGEKQAYLTTGVRRRQLRAGGRRVLAMREADLTRDRLGSREGRRVREYMDMTRRGVGAPSAAAARMADQARIQRRALARRGGTEQEMRAQMHRQQRAIGLQQAEDKRANEDRFGNLAVQQHDRSEMERQRAMKDYQQTLGNLMRTYSTMRPGYGNLMLQSRVLPAAQMGAPPREVSGGNSWVDKLKTFGGGIAGSFLG